VIVSQILKSTHLAGFDFDLSQCDLDRSKAQTIADQLRKEYGSTIKASDLFGKGTSITPSRIAETIEKGLHRADSSATGPTNLIGSGNATARRKRSFHDIDTGSLIASDSRSMTESSTAEPDRQITASPGFRIYAQTWM
jgi:hypothetical protein